jgi:hypothetical protein
MPAQARRAEDAHALGRGHATTAHTYRRRNRAHVERLKMIEGHFNSLLLFNPYQIKHSFVVVQFPPSILYSKLKFYSPLTYKIVFLASSMV